MPKDNTYDSLIKVLIVGDSGVGKTNMLLRFCDNNFLTSHLTTIGIDFKTKTMNIDGKKLRVQIWDTAGQQRFKTITQTYYRGAMGIFITYAVDDRASFDNIEAWLKQIKLHSSPNVVKLLIGNKSDTTKREVSREEGKRVADEMGIDFFQTSAKQNVNIQTSFSQMAKLVHRKLSEEDEIGVLTFTGSKINKKTKSIQKKEKCC